MEKTFRARTNVRNEEGGNLRNPSLGFFRLRAKLRIADITSESARLPEEKEISNDCQLTGASQPTVRKSLAPDRKV